METITAYKTRNGHYGFNDPASEHDFIIFDDGDHAIDEQGIIWQVVTELEDEENVSYLTFEDGKHLFNYAEDGEAIPWMRAHYEINNLPDGQYSLYEIQEIYNDAFIDIDWDKVEEEMDSEDVFNLMKECKDEECFCDYLSQKYGYDNIEENI